jgi:hypothetical protein
MHISTYTCIYYYIELYRVRIYSGVPPKVIESIGDPELCPERGYQSIRCNHLASTPILWRWFSTRRHVLQQSARARNDRLDASLYAHVRAGTQWWGRMKVLSAETARSSEPTLKQDLPSIYQRRPRVW